MHRGAEGLPRSSTHPSGPWRRVLGLLVLALGAAGCEGAIVSPSPSGEDSQAVSCNASQLSAFRARRLTPEEYRHAVTDIFGGRIQPSARYPQLYGKALTGFSSEPVLGNVGESAARELMIAAEDVGEQLVAQLPQLLPCAAQSPNEACATRFIDTFIRRAWRRTLDVEERWPGHQPGCGPDEKSSLMKLDCTGDRSFSVSVSAGHLTEPVRDMDTLTGTRHPSDGYDFQ